MTGPPVDPAGAAAERYAAPGRGAGQLAAPALPPSTAKQAPDLNFCSEARGNPGSGKHGDACGQEAEWAAFFRAEWLPVVRLLQLSFGEASMPDAADAAQDAFMELFRHWDSVRSPRAWVRTVAVRHMMRQMVRDRNHLYRAGAAASPEPEPWCAAAASPAEIFDEKQAVLAALRQLPEMQQRVMALVYDGFSAREAAEMLGMTEAAVRQSLQRGRRKLRNMHYESDPVFRRMP